MKQDITHFDLNALSKLIKNKIISPTELLEAFSKNILLKNNKINAIVTISENAKTDALQAENEINQCKVELENMATQYNKCND